ncbi:MAG: N-acetyl-gamma-glutamyl-phosphate reductase [Lachnospiraceae bacterium]|nr:N-acetyl-gamma-glutamyl-phosphate reductase [Lachnospiraceae bacterium]
MKTKVYIDGQSGTTGLQIYDRLGKRDDIDLLLIDRDKRHDTKERKKFINAADIVFLCLPDAEAVKACDLIGNDRVKVIDASTAHRVAPGWTYGFPELSHEQREAVRTAKRLANPGCHATGMIAITAPLVKAGILPCDYPVAVYSLTGYSGGGKKMIADYEDTDRPNGLKAGNEDRLSSPGIYGLGLDHKHLPEMKAYSGLDHDPLFLPVVDDYYKGMASTVLLEGSLLNVPHDVNDNGDALLNMITDVYKEHYKDQYFVRVVGTDFSEKTLYANTLAGTNFLDIYVYGSKGRLGVTAIFDNLGKGASGAAVQNMNIMMGIDEKVSLI